MAEDKKVNFFLTFFYIFTFILLGYTLINSSSPATENPADPENKTDKIVPAVDNYGIPADLFKVTTHKIKLNETISSIFNMAGVADSTIFNLQNNFKDIFNFRKVIAGKPYRIYTSKDPSKCLKYFVYEKDPINYVVVELNDIIKVYKGKHQITRKRKEISGIIHHSLYNALERNEADPELFVRLSDIFAWQIDFYHIQKGDNFKVIYEEKLVGSNVIGVGKIMGAYFNHMGEVYYAIPFTVDGKIEYFDENGRSLRKAFLKAPLQYSRISSRFSHKRFHPILRRYQAHLGTDYAAPTGTPIRSVGEGIVVAASYSSGNGRFVKIRHNSVYTTQYLHMSKFAANIRSGISVKQGQIIGYVGSTGLATGPHLCYRLWKNGVQVDPLREKLPPSKPIDENYKERFLKIRDRVIWDLDKIKYNYSNSTELADEI